MSRSLPRATTVVAMSSTSGVWFAGAPAAKGLAPSSALAPPWGGSAGEEFVKTSTHVEAERRSLGRPRQAQHLRVQRLLEAFEWGSEAAPASRSARSSRSEWNGARPPLPRLHSSC